MRGRRSLTIAALAGAALVLGACSSGSDDAASTPTATVTETVTTTPSETATPTASATNSPSPSASPTTASNRCRPAGLSASVTTLDSGAGQRYAAVVLENTSTKACTITGYPGLQLITTTGNVPTRVKRLAKPAPKTVRLAPGQSASSAIQWAVIASGNEPTTGPCQPEASSLLVTPPDATRSLSTAWTGGPVCAKGRFSTEAFVAGTGS